MDILKIGHRGAKGHIAENTLESIEKAISFGVNIIEFDVHLSKDNIPVVIHDFTLDRTTNGKGNVSDKTLLELKEVKVEGKYLIPTLEEVFDYANRKCLLNIELKAKGSSIEVVRIIEKYIQKGWKYSDFLISSFDYEQLDNVYILNKNISLGILSEESTEKAEQKARELNSEILILYYKLLNEDLIKQLKSKGFKIFVWTVNSEDDIKRMKHYRVNGIISDFPDRI